jgi:type IV pilus biogenesis protein CpaD/CtpE
MKYVIIIVAALALAGCSMFGGKKTRLVPQAYMPDPPAILMESPKELNTILKESAKSDSPEGVKEND